MDNNLTFKKPQYNPTMRKLPNFAITLLPIVFLFARCSPKETEEKVSNSEIKQSLDFSKEGMVWIEGGSFFMGTNEQEAYHVERPAVKRTVNGFWMDATEVTNAQFAKFVEETGYVTVAERKPDWEEMKLQLPPGTPKPAEEDLQPGSLVFSPPAQSVSTQSNDLSLWWKWVIGANWKHPEGPESTIKGKENHPVVHMASEDAESYAKWAGKRLPTEAEWEYAAKGGKDHQRYAWGVDFRPNGQFMANTFQGDFPHSNEGRDGFLGTAPVKNFPPNEFGLYDIIGNVWEMTSDWFDAATFLRISGEAPALDSAISKCYNPDNPYAMEKVIKGGSFLCADDYCINYRPSARQGHAYDSGTSNVGFRCVADNK